MPIRTNHITSRTGTLNSTTLHLVLIVLAGLLVYSNTFNVPFQWDEHFYIKENPLVRDPGSFFEPAGEETGFYHIVKKRLLGYMTFALNYRLHGFDVTGYHIFNLAVHLLNGLLVYLIAMYACKTPVLVNSSLSKQSKYIAFFTGLIFVSHPVQTEAVTYIFQRFVSLTTFFSLFSLLMYVKWRLVVDSEGFVNLRSLACYTLAFVSAILAMKIKENAFTLPMTVILFEFLFFRGTTGYKDPLNFFVGITGIRPARKAHVIRLLRLYPMLLTLLIIPLTITGFDNSPLEISSPKSPSMMGYGELSRALVFPFLLIPPVPGGLHGIPLKGQFIGAQAPCIRHTLVFPYAFCGINHHPPPDGDQRVQALSPLSGGLPGDRRLGLLHSRKIQGETESCNSSSHNYPGPRYGRSSDLNLCP
jgi:hypothetical protein